MFKKWLMVFAMLAATSNNAFALAFPYVGGGVGWQNNHGYSGLLGNVFGGYGSTLGEAEKFYLGGELFMNLISLPINTDLNRRVTYAFGATLIPGFFINANALLYARLGLVTTHLYKPDNTETGTQLGAGLQLSLNPTWDARVEYVYGTSAFFEDFGSTRSSQLILALVYKFN